MGRAWGPGLHVPLTMTGNRPLCRHCVPPRRVR